MQGGGVKSVVTIKKPLRCIVVAFWRVKVGQNIFYFNLIS